MREPVVDFLNHGMLPFVGREKEVERIVSFWRGSIDSGGLRALLLTGEAGSGKSRLIEEIIPQIEGEGGVVVHAKLRADSAIALSPLLSLAAWSSPSAGPLLREEPEPGLPSIIGAIRRLCRLRRTVLIVEDAHLFEGTALREFSLFVEALADEALALLVVSRPAELPARGAIEAYLSEEIPLTLLDNTNLHELWERLFGGTVPESAVTALEGATLGNPLAFRSALRGAINAGILVEKKNEWQVAVSISAFREMAVRSAQRLTEGMASHLTDEERRAAQQLAPLGEVFAPEAAEKLIPDSERMISHLLFKGILVRSTTASASLRDPDVRGLPLIFAHSLLHRSLLEQSEVDPLALLTIILSDAPIYSVTPFLFLEAHPPADPLSVEFALQLVEATQVIANRIDRTADWQLALKIWSIVDPWFESAEANRPDDPDVLKLSLNRLVHRTNLLGRNDESDEYYALTNQLLEATKEAETTGEEWMVIVRIRAHTHLFRFMSRRNREGCADVIGSVEALVNAFPTMQVNQFYRSFIRVVASCAYIFGFYLDDLRYVENAWRRAVDQSEDDPDLKDLWLNDFGYYLLSSFTTPEELAKRHVLLADLHKARVDRPYYYIREIAFRMETGWYKHALDLMDKYRPMLRDIGLIRTVYSCILYECEALTAIGAPIETILAKGLEVIGDPQAHGNDLRRNHLGRHLLAGSLMKGHLQDMDTIVAALEFPEAMQPLITRILTALPSLDRLRNVELVKPTSGPGSIDIDDPDIDLDYFIPITQGLIDNVTPAENDLENLRTFLETPILRRYTILSLHTALSLAAALEKQGFLQIDEAWKASMQIGINSALEWLAERHLATHGGFFLREHGNRLSGVEQEKWRAKFDTVDGAQLPTVSTEDQPIRITMFGAITFRRPGGEIERLRGARNHLMLGLLIADRMLKKPLTRNAFLAMASGVEDDHDRARRTMNMAVLRLREATGPDIVLTDQETPRLNGDRVTVDLIEARRALTNADLLARKRKLTQAIEELRAVFELSGGDVPFPGLYEDLFENLRREFEDDLLTVTVALGRQLLAERDYEHAEDILSQAIDILPESDDLQELFRRAANGMHGIEEEIDEEALLAGEEE